MHAQLCRSVPEFADRFPCTKVVGAEPAIATELLFGGPIKRVKANPQVVAMRVANELAETRFFFHSPVTCFGLAFGLNDAPTIVPPAVIVVGGIRRQPSRRRGGVMRVGGPGSEYEPVSAF